MTEKKISVGEQVYSDAVDFEKRLWNREDYGEDDITLFSNIMDFVEANLKSFIAYHNEQKGEYCCINCGKLVEEPDASYCEECFRKGEL